MYANLKGVVKMKSIAKSFTFAVMLMFVSCGVFAYDLPKDTLHVERFSSASNGTATGKTIGQHTFIKRYYTAAECDAQALLYNTQTNVIIGGVNFPVLTIAKCEAINHSIYQ